MASFHETVYDCTAKQQHHEYQECGIYRYSIEHHNRGVERIAERGDDRHDAEHMHPYADRLDCHRFRSSRFAQQLTSDDIELHETDNPAYNVAYRKYYACHGDDRIVLDDRHIPLQRLVVVFV